MRTVALIALLALALEKVTRRYLSPVKGRLVSPFGERINPITKIKEFHNGIDIAIPSGTPIRSPASGKVINVYSSLAGGNQIILSHPSGEITGYAHLSKSLVKTGDKVAKGQVFAYSGVTGQVTGAHLHLSLRNKQGKYINPANYFPGLV
jgi:murein DD-endopeptidase MepM/ murein hydrolase activator NlpD